MMWRAISAKPSFDELHVMAWPGQAGTLWARSEGTNGQAREGMRRASTGAPVHYGYTCRTKLVLAWGGLS